MSTTAPDAPSASNQSSAADFSPGLTAPVDEKKLGNVERAQLKETIKRMQCETLQLRSEVLQKEINTMMDSIDAKCAAYTKIMHQLHELGGLSEKHQKGHDALVDKLSGPAENEIAGSFGPDPHEMMNIIQNELATKGADKSAGSSAINEFDESIAQAEIWERMRTARSIDGKSK
jgi:hypothetical protein